MSLPYWDRTRKKDMSYLPVDHDPRAPLLAQPSPGTSKDPARGPARSYNSVTVDSPHSLRPTETDDSDPFNPWAAGQTQPQPPPPNPTQKTPPKRDAPDQPQQQGGSNPIPDDFKVGVNVHSSTVDIRHVFIRKVYSILLIQILGTIGVAYWILRSSEFLTWVEAHFWVYYAILGVAVVTLLTLFFVPLKFPVNILFLAIFTACEAFGVGVSIAAYDEMVIMLALIITTGIFIGLTLFTLQSKRDFIGLASYLSGCLAGLIFAGVVMRFIPFDRTRELIYAIFCIFIFSGYVMLDTHLISKRLSPDEYVMGAVLLYVDFLQVFIYVLEALGDKDKKKNASSETAGTG